MEGRYIENEILYKYVKIVCCSLALVFINADVHNQNQSSVE